jgi:GTP cyclohydrolase I
MKRTLDLTKAEIAAKDLLTNLGLDLTDPNYEGAPRRIVEVLAEFTS